MARPLVSAIVAGEVGSRETARTVRLLFEGAPGGCEVIVVGVHPDSTADSLERAGAVVVRGDRPSPAMRLEGVAHATGDFLLFCHTPIEPSPGWGRALLSDAFADPGVGAAGPALRALGQPRDLAMIGGLTFLDTALNIGWLPVPTDLQPVAALSGCFLVVRRDAYEAVGGLDSQLSEGFWNLDLCLSLWRCGYECVLNPHAEVAFRMGNTSSEELDWEDHLANLHRIASVHFDDDDLATVTANLGSDPLFAPVRERQTSDGTLFRHRQLARLAPRFAGAVLSDLCGGLFASDSDGRPSKLQGSSQAETAYTDINRQGWARWAAAATFASRPVTDEELTHPREMLDPHDWLPWADIATVLCLGGAGGRQAPLLAALGLGVVVVDLSPDQLAIDAEVAESKGLDLELLEGDMLDLSVLGDRVFDLVYQPVSSCYIPDVRHMYQEVARVLRPGGLYHVEHWNPLHIQLEGLGTWDGSSYRIIHPQDSRTPVAYLTPSGEEDEPRVLWHFVHSVGDLVGGLLDAGFAIRRFAQSSHDDPDALPGSPSHLESFAPSFFRILAARS
jgi:SAM-dependent methyltransferase